MSRGRPISRRRFLGGAGSAMALPWLASLADVGRAAGGQTPSAPCRLLFYFVPNGSVHGSYDPTPIGPAWKPSGILTPLAAIKDAVIPFKGLYSAGHAGGSGPHTQATGAFLTCEPITFHPGGGVSAGVSVDQVAAQAIGGSTRFRSLELGAAPPTFSGFCEESYSCAYLQSISWSGPQTPLGKMVDPKAVFNRLFEGYDGQKSIEEQAIRELERKSVLDYVLGASKALRRSLSSADGYRLDEFMTGIRELERKVNLPAPLCEPPQTPGSGLGLPARAALMNELMVLAFRCDLTRVITFMLDNGFATTPYTWLGLNDAHHWYTHHSGDEAMKAATRDIGKWGVQQFANLVAMMGQVEEGEGTLLDHSLLMFGNSVGECNYHNPHNAATILAGRGCGAVSPGRSMEVSEPTPRANLYTAMLQAAGVGVSSFGKFGTGPLAGLAAAP